VHDTCRYVNEVTRFGVDHRLAAWSELKSHRPRHNIEAALVVAVVMPARGGFGLGVNKSGPQTSYVDGSSAAHPGGGIGVDKRLCSDYSDWF
jgi:hypothetical protein